MIYFDHNATFPLCPAARDAWLDATERFIGNPSSPHRIGARADAAMTVAREKLATFLGCDPHAIVWTSGATESNNTVVRHFAAKGTGEAWISAIEHPSVLDPTRRAFPRTHRLIPVGRDGVADLNWLHGQLAKRRPAFVGLMAANNETGVIQPWREALLLCRDHGVPFFCDAAQLVGKLPARGLGECDFVSGCAHKFGGPLGVGFLKCSGRLHPLLHGGPQEDGRRAGTENVCGILAMVAGLDHREEALRVGDQERRCVWRDQFVESMQRALPGLEIIGATAERLWNTVSTALPELDGRQRWVVKLDKQGFAVSTGSACSSGQEKPSHVLSAMGVKAEVAARVIRFSGGWETTERDWKDLGRCVAEMAAAAVATGTSSS